MWDSLCQEIAGNKSQLHTRSVMAINRSPRLLPWLCASLPPESNTAHRIPASREPQSSLPLASSAVHHRIKELWVVVEMKDTYLSTE